MEDDMETEIGGEDETRKRLREEGYSEIVVEHWLHPRNVGPMKYCDGEGSATSPCGDSMWIWLRVRNGSIDDACFVSDICIGAVVSGSILTEMIKQRPIGEALTITGRDILRELGGLPEQFAHCAILAADTLKEALKDYRTFAKEPWKRAYQPKRP
jgi:nitrogen fixation protein NifU and related proteins